MNYKSIDDLYKETLTEPNQAYEYLKDALSAKAYDGTVDYDNITRAISHVARSFGVDEMVSRTSLSRAQIYKISNGNANLTLKNIIVLLKAFGLRFSVVMDDIDNSGYQPAKPLDVAQYIVHVMSNRTPITAQWLQKILYYSQANYAVSYGRPLFAAKIEAWRYGPVIREVYVKHRGQKNLASVTFSKNVTISSEQRRSVDKTIEKYGSSSGDVLSALTHSEQPWIQARGDLSSNEPSDQEITLESMISFYSSQRMSFDFDDNIEG